MKAFKCDQMSVTLKLDLHNMQYLTLFIMFFFASCFFVDDVTKSNISVTTCPTVSFIKQTSDLSTRPHTVNVGTKEEIRSFKDLAKQIITCLLCHSFSTALVLYVNACLEKKILNFTLTYRFFVITQTDGRTNKRTYRQANRQEKTILCGWFDLYKNFK